MECPCHPPGKFIQPRWSIHIIPPDNSVHSWQSVGSDNNINLKQTFGLWKMHPPATSKPASNPKWLKMHWSHAHASNSWKGNFSGVGSKFWFRRAREWAYVYRDPMFSLTTRLENSRFFYPHAGDNTGLSAMHFFPPVL